MNSSFFSVQGAGYKVRQVVEYKVLKEGLNKVRFLNSFFILQLIQLQYQFEIYLR